VNPHPPPLWSDEYTGPRWTYGLTYRPLGVATVPRGFILGSQRTHPLYPFGTIDYPRELTHQEITGYQLLLEADA